MLNKKMNKELLDILSKRGSQKFYLTGKALPPAATTDTSANNCGQSSLNDPEAFPKSSAVENTPVGQPSAGAKSSRIEADPTPQLGIFDDSIPTFEEMQPQPEQSRCHIPEEAMKFMKCWLGLDNQFLPQSEIFKRTGITSGSRQNKIKKTLAAYGCFIEHILPRGKGKSIFWEPTPVARALAGISETKVKSKGGFVHQGLAGLIAETAKRKGYKVEIEAFQANGKAIDIVLHKGEEQPIWIEIATSFPMDKECHNIVKDFESGLMPNKLIIACRDSKMKNELLELVSTNPQIQPYRDKIEILLALNLVEFK